MNLFSSTTFYRRSNIHTSHIYYERSNSTAIVMDDGDLATKIFYISQSIEFLRAITCISFTSYIYYIFVSEYSISTMYLAYIKFIHELPTSITCFVQGIINENLAGLLYLTKNEPYCYAMLL